MTYGSIAEQILAGKDKDAKILAENMLEEATSKGEIETRGEVYLLGAGPGNDYCRFGCYSS